jgi:hypothetical protein
VFYSRCEVLVDGLTHYREARAFLVQLAMSEGQVAPLAAAGLIKGNFVPFLNDEERTLLITALDSKSLTARRVSHSQAALRSSLLATIIISHSEKSDGQAPIYRYQ